ncbi:MAG: sigma-70 family RNA polymerase sigma factor [Calditrichaeota bacterium]|nr:MAG: sigma-70 family RNA polymerase sigma factor [Calditrichota bacterium]
MSLAQEKEIKRYIQKSLDGDPKAFEWIVRKYQKRLYYTILQIVMNHEDASDILQDTFVKAYTKLSTYDQAFPFYPWLYRIAINTTINFKKQKNRNRLYSLNDNDNNHKLDLSKPANQIFDAEEQELIKDLKKALEKIPNEQRMVFVLRVREGLSYQEISEHLQISMGTVMSRLARARNKLRVLLKEYVGNNLNGAKYEL